MPNAWVFTGANIPRTVEQEVSHGRTRLAVKNVKISLKVAVCYYHPYCAGKPPSYEQVWQCVPPYKPGMDNVIGEQVPIFQLLLIVQYDMVSLL